MQPGAAVPAVPGHGAGGPAAGVGQPENGTENGSETDAGIVSIDSVGNVTERGSDGRAYVWAGDEQSTTLGFRGPAGMGFEYFTVCLAIAGEDGTTSLGCRRVAPGRTDATLRVNWTPEEPRTGSLVVSAHGGNQLTTYRLDESETRLQVIERGGDADNDKLANERELSVGTNLSDTDTDDDGLMDGAEVTEYDTNPLLADTDGDGVRDAVEIQQGTDPRRLDTDGDGLNDNEEITGETDPTMPDTDLDGLDDDVEVEIGTDPTVADTDDDGIVDGVERGVGTDPTRADTDGDLLADGVERRLGTDPDSSVFPGVVLLGLLGLAVAGAWAARRGGLGVGSVRSARGDDPDRGAGGDELAGEDDVDDGPLTDRDRIRQLLEQAGGRLKQARIVEETSWSKAKVSRVLSGMEDDGEISKIRIGRENLICLKGQEPDLARPSV